MANIPIVEDKLALRIVGFHAEEAGFIDNILAAGLPGPFGATSGAPYDNAAVAEDDINTSKVNGGRIGLRWTPNENWTIDAQALYQKTKGDGFGDADLVEVYMPALLSARWSKYAIPTTSGKTSGISCP